MGLALPSQPELVVNENLDELAELARSAGTVVVGRNLQFRRAPDGRTLIGRGKVNEIAKTADELGANVVVFDDNLTPNQVRNLEEVIPCAVIDRSALILDLFVRRARTREARTQVELAQLMYQLPRLTGRWTHLSRQVGGIGVRGGEGETQLEVDRRLLRNRIKQLKRDLSKIKKTRALHRRGRRGEPVVALAGYTNAGKSTLFNCLTRAGVQAEDKLFATLDSKLRKGSLGGTTTAIFVDRVGFIRKLPHHLVDSFVVRSKKSATPLSSFTSSTGITRGGTNTWTLARQYFQISESTPIAFWLFLIKQTDATRPLAQSTVAGQSQPKLVTVSKS